MEVRLGADALIIALDERLTSNTITMIANNDTLVAVITRVIACGSGSHAS